jgi:hypothetical protein
MKMPIKMLAGVAAVAIATLATAIPAFAEGSFTSHMSGVRVGFESRRWDDKNEDSKGTIVSLRYCHYMKEPSHEPKSAQFTLNLIKDTLFDEARGNVKYDCSGSTWKQYDWGRQPAGKYFFRVTKLGPSGITAANADGVKVSW